ncbi:MAG: CCA tRNA nucleotidyltransferase [Tenericutes bacterium HGW-Tenericutes-1]|jgi:tRNA nucleotidyltransferase (CCA-adding enzyme)|nr:MAG: CCA tRNA nucleotidyltransferase [Tenericutes bacterium HGW-Tenericutes-1]
MGIAVDAGKKIISLLKANGYDAYFVGGFVRDFLLGVKSADIDIATSALPEEIINLFPKSKATGEKYGTVSVFTEECVFEVTTFRNEGEYIDHRHPSFVDFTKSIHEDLKRRDFSINAMAMDEDMKIIDLFHGKSDIYNKKIRSVGNPDIRFKEDALRILRAFRFVSKLGFDIETLTFESIYNHIDLLKSIANERILQELKQTFEGTYTIKALHLMYQARLGDVFLELKPALELISKMNDLSISYYEFFALSSVTGDFRYDELWRFSNRELSLINQIHDIAIATSNDAFNELIVYANGYEICQMANNVNCIINPSNNQTELISKLYQDMPIHKTCDLAFKGQDILDLKLLTDARLIGDLIDDITYQIITHQLENEYFKIKKYVIDKLSIHASLGEE